MTGFTTTLNDAGAYSTTYTQPVGTNVSSINTSAGLVRGGLGSGNAAAQGYTGPDASNRSLWLDVFGGEILAAYEMNTIMEGKHVVKMLNGARSWRFPRT